MLFVIGTFLAILLGCGATLAVWATYMVITKWSKEV